jgi:hypothetical protein
MKDKIKILTIIGAIIAFVGIVISLLDLFGVFANKDRLSLIEEIRKTGVADKKTAGFDQFLKAFPPPDGWELKDIKGIGPLSLIKSGGRITPTGPIIYTGYGKQTGRIVDFDGFVEWAKHTPYPWISWGITFLGWLIVVLGIFLENKKSK